MSIDSVHLKYSVQVPYNVLMTYNVHVTYNDQDNLTIFQERIVIKFYPQNLHSFIFDYTFLSSIIVSAVAGESP